MHVKYTHPCSINATWVMQYRLERQIRALPTLSLAVNQARFGVLRWRIPDILSICKLNQIVVDRLLWKISPIRRLAKLANHLKSTPKKAQKIYRKKKLAAPAVPNQPGMVIGNEKGDVSTSDLRTRFLTTLR